MNYTPKEELYQRINKLQELMKENNIEGAIITENADLFYFAGTIQSSNLFIPLKGEPLLMTRRVFERAKEESAIENIVPLKSVKELPDILKGEGYSYPETIGMELDVLPVNNFKFYEKILTPAKIVDISRFIKEVRMLKSTFEVEKLKEAASLIDEVYQEIPNIIRAGISEIELAAEIEMLARSKGHQGLVRMRAFNQELFFGQLLSGASGGMASFFDGPAGGQGLSPAHPQSASFKRLKPGEPILIDYSGVKDGYIVDQTRVYAISSLEDKLIKAYENSLQIQKEIIKFVKVGETTCSELYQFALDAANESGLADYFMGYKSNQVKFLGHGVGIELDELPVIAKGFNQVIVPGMVMAIEPKFVFPNEGAVGIENTWVVTEKGLEKITITPEKLIIV